MKRFNEYIFEDLNNALVEPSSNAAAEAKKLKGDQYKLDKNKNGKLDSQDFKKTLEQIRDDGTILSQKSLDASASGAIEVKEEYRGNKYGKCNSS